MLDRARNVLAQETGTNSKRTSAYIQGVYPTHLSRGQGCTVWDHQGKSYVDFIGALGAIILGYSNPKVTEAVQKQAKDGPIFSMPHPLEIEVAELVQALVPSAEKIRFFKNGDDATTAAVRIARAYKKDSLGLILSEGYHGRSDIWTSLTPPAVGVKGRHLVAPFDGDTTQTTAVILEPVALDASETRKEQLTEYLKNKSTLWIFDEIITGFRVPKYSISGWWDLKPDLICLGKAMANGYPLSVIGGKKEIMDCDEYFLSTTFSSEAVSLAAAKATLEELQKKSLDDLLFYGQRLQNRFNEICGPYVTTRLEGYGTRAMLNVGEPDTWLVMQELCKAGYLVGKAWFYSFAHMESDIEEKFLNVLSDIVHKVNRGGVKLEGKAPVQTFKR